MGRRRVAPTILVAAKKSSGLLRGPQHSQSKPRRQKPQKQHENRSSKKGLAKRAGAKRRIDSRRSAHHRQNDTCGNKHPMFCRTRNQCVEPAHQSRTREAGEPDNVGQRETSQQDDRENRLPPRFAGQLWFHFLIDRRKGTRFDWKRRRLLWKQPRPAKSQRNPRGNQKRHQRYQRYAWIDQQ
jgi:hypothetical protein